jgi:ribosomal protein S18 acetylase RimI-like enzyme
MRSLTLFASEYHSDRYLKVETSGRQPELTWELRSVARGRGRGITRQLDGGSLDALAQLFGPVETLRFIGAFHGEKLVGLLTWKLEKWNQTVWLCDIRVRAEYRRRGIASRLLEDLQWAAVRAEARGIMLETQSANTRAIEFYLAKGFRLVGLNSALYSDRDSPMVEVALFFYRSLGG